MAGEFFGANLKMNPPTKEEVVRLLQGYVDNNICGFDKGICGDSGRKIVAFLPDIHLGYLVGGHPDLVASLRERNIRLGVQDVSEFFSGAHTGETSPLWIRDFGGKYVLIGHSEVRGVFESVTAQVEEIDMLFNRKIKKSLENGLDVVYCVGEPEREKRKEDTLLYVGEQLKLGLEGISDADLKDRVVVAYEPRWAIGKGKKPPTKKQIEEVVREILRINPCYLLVYGGNMKPENVGEIMSVPGVSGGLVGGACLDAGSFSQIVNYR